MLSNIITKAPEFRIQHVWYNVIQYGMTSSNAITFSEECALVCINYLQSCLTHGVCIVTAGTWKVRDRIMAHTKVMSYR